MKHVLLIISEEINQTSMQSCKILATSVLSFKFIENIKTTNFQPKLKRIVLSIFTLVVSCPQNYFPHFLESKCHATLIF